jgi:hypothetical protein
LCPQSVYLYGLKPEMADQGYKHEFILAALLSRTMTYYVFKRFAEGDPARAHAKLGPRPVGVPADARCRILEHGKLLDRKVPLGGPDDKSIELLLRQLWGLRAEDGAYINGEFAALLTTQAILDLFPDGVPGAAVVSERLESRLGGREISS